MIWIVALIKLVVICSVISDLASFVGELIDYVVVSKIKAVGVIKSLLVYLLTCPRCFSFWFSLCWSGGDLFTSAVVALIMSGVLFIKSKYFRGPTKIE